MRNSMFVALIFAVSQGVGYVKAQPLVGNHYLVPANPSSADNLKLIMLRSCSDLVPYRANAYQVSMAQNNITVTRGELVPGLVPTCAPSPRDEIDLGRLPAGNYTLTVINAASGVTPSRPEFSDVPFTVTDARQLQAAPYVRLDYSGHWWDPNDSGWGLFIWHDARDNLLAALFTYATDGKPTWYVFQPTLRTFAATNSVNLLQTSRSPGSTVPPPNPTSYSVAGTASLDFTQLNTAFFDSAGAAKFSYTLTGGGTTVRNIQLFKP